MTAMTSNPLQGQFGTPSHTVLHISDVHFVSGGDLLNDSIDSDANLARLFRELRKSSISPDALLFTGDLTDAGKADAYARLRALVEPICQDYGAELIWMMGNHDSRPEFRQNLLDLQPTQDPVDATFDVNGLRIIALDSSVPGQHYGDLTDDQLDWLADQLKTPAPFGTIVGIHHPPIPSPLGIISMVELHHQDRLAEVIRGTDVRTILSGHLHYNTTSTFAGGIPVSVASAVCYSQDLHVVYPGSRGMNGAQSYNLVQVYEDRILHTVVPIGSFPTVYEMTPEILAAFIDKDRTDRAEAGAADSARSADQPLAPAPGPAKA